MSNIIMPGAPECPLCYKPMREIMTRGGNMYVCLGATCMVNINKHDPVCGRWREKEENAPDCPICGSKMRWFFRSTDNYKKVQCPTCTGKGRLSQVEVGRVEDMSPAAQQAWSFDPKDL